MFGRMDSVVAPRGMVVVSSPPIPPTFSAPVVLTATDLRTPMLEPDSHCSASSKPAPQVEIPVEDPEDQDTLDTQPGARCRLLACCCVQCALVGSFLTVILTAFYLS